MSLRRKRVLGDEQLLAQEILILEATESVCELIRRDGVKTFADLAAAVGCSDRVLSELMRWDRDLMVRQLADMAYALGHTFTLVPERWESRELLVGHSRRTR